MPYKDDEDRNANRRLKHLVHRNLRYRDQGLEPLEPEERSSPVKCQDCGKVTSASCPGVFRHFSDCPRYHQVYWSRRGTCRL